MQKLNLRMQKLNFPGTPHWRGLALIGAQKNTPDLSFYYMKLYTPSIPLIEGFRTSFAPPFFSLTRREKKSMASGTEIGCACFAAALI